MTLRSRIFRSPRQTIAVHRPTGRRDPVSLHLLGPEDLDPICDLHRFIHSTLEHPETLYPRQRNYFHRILNGEGRLFVAVCEDRKIAYVTLRFPGHSSENYGWDLGLPADELSTMAQLDGAAVHPDYRGSRLHNFMSIRRIRLGRLLGYRHFSALASPMSPYSLHSHLVSGLRVKGIKVDEDGPNFLLHMDSRARVENPGAPEVQVAIDDFDGHRKALDQALEGYHLDRGNAPPRLAYACTPTPTP